MDGYYNRRSYGRRSYDRGYGKGYNRGYDRGRDNDREEVIQPEWIVETAEMSSPKGKYIRVRTKKQGYYVPEEDKYAYELFKGWWDNPNAHHDYRYIAKGGRIYIEPIDKPQSKENAQSNEKPIPSPPPATTNAIDTQTAISEIRRLITLLENLEARLSK